MNRYLLAGAAAAALALGAGAANAQAKFDVKVGGDAYFEAGYVDQDVDSGLRSTEFRNRMRINIIPSAKADNGLEYGARMRLRANSGASNTRTTDADRAYIFAQGTFGQVRMGVSNSFNDETYVTASMDYLKLGAYDDVTAWINLPSSTAGTVTGNSILNPSIAPDANSTKIVYFSPRMAGLQLGASYTPRNDSSNTDISRSKPTGTLAGTSNGIYQDMVEVGANYNNTFGGVTVKASAGYMWGRAVDDVVGSNYKDLNAWQLGANVGYAGFTLGGSYIDYGKSGQNERTGVFTETTRNWTVGAQYTTGPIVVGANYKNGKDAGSLGTTGDRELQVYEIGVGYTVAPGLTLQAQYDYFDLDNDASAADDKGNVVLVRSILAF
ncbi:Major outer membrane protein OmaA [Azospirillum lipoferum 4B]|uniref:Major outer membrane protein OmaA n=2 Tax=Azospirillum lipoferum TaxID=193 RepID=G7Z7T4_AZOL4|nr:Major outer membrane protein OmaA [Azospirillum lipoferum 4B]